MAEQQQASFDSVTLERVKYAIATRLGMEFSNAECAVHLDEMLDDLLVQVRFTMLAQCDMDQEVYVCSHPADWWEAFKERWLTRWFPKWFPVECTTHTVTARVVYPMLTVKLPQRAHFVDFKIRRSEPLVPRRGDDDEEEK